METTPLLALTDQTYAIDQSSIVAATDTNGTIIYANSKFCEISGYSLEELLGKNHRILNSGFHDQAFFQMMWSTITSGKIWKGEVRNRKKNGEFYWVDTTIIPFKDPLTGKVIRFVSIRHEITKLKEAQEIILLQQEQAVLSGKFSAIGEIAATITHEINNPLAVILGRTEMLKSLLAKPNPDLGTVARMIEIIALNGQRIEKIVEAMRSYSHNSSASDKGFFDSTEIISQVLDLCAERFRSHGIDLKVSPPPMQTKVYCNSTHLFQILLNLLNNSFDAVRSLENPWVELAVKKKTAMSVVEFAVTDSGPGIPQALHEKIFYPFFSTKEKKFGTGIGLSLSKNLAEQNGGQLQLDNSSQHTRFVLALPIGHA